MEIIVTLQTESFSRDFLLPADVKLKELYPRLLNALQNASNRFAQWKGLLLETDEGAFLDLEATLADYGMCTGKRLYVIQEACGDGV